MRQLPGRVGVLSFVAMRPVVPKDPRRPGTAFAQSSACGGCLSDVTMTEP